MTWIIIIAGAGILLAWANSAREYYVVLKAQIGFEYGRSQWIRPGVRSRMIRRSIFWFLPAKTYHRRQSSWEIQLELLRQQAAAERRNLEGGHASSNA